MRRRQRPKPVNPWFQLERDDYGVMGWVLLVKLLILSYGIISYQVNTDNGLQSLGDVLGLWNRWDAPHYLDIAANGYQSTGDARYFIVFYPLFPWLVKGVAILLGDYVVGAFVISTLASLGVGVVLRRLLSLDYHPTLAGRAVWFLLIFPTSYFLHIGYTESLFLALALGSLLAMRTNHWAIAGLLGAGASLARVNGLLLLPVAGVEILYRLSQRQRWQLQWFWAGLIPIGFGIYLLCNYLVTGNPFAFRGYLHEFWHKDLAWPWVGIEKVIQAIGQPPPSRQWMVGGQELLFIGLGTVAMVWSWWRLRPTYSAWITLNLLLMTSTEFILSVPRYTLILFPIPLLFAHLSQGRFEFTLITIWSVLSLALFTGLFVQGKWAF
jgi:Gpi18-like mannosyltransferase